MALTLSSNAAILLYLNFLKYFVSWDLLVDVSTTIGASADIVGYTKAILQWGSIS
jgi:hypothetical protein